MPHCMLDLETLGFTPDCVILTFGAVKFDPYSSDEPNAPMYLRLNVEQQTELGRVVADSTLEWWAKQDPAVFEEAMSDEGRIDIEEFTTELNRYLVGVDKIWAQGPLFDIAILEHLYKQLGKPVPWQFWQIRDSRTVMDMGNDGAKTGNKDAHNALADAYQQAIAVQDIYNECGVKKKVR